MWKPNFYEWRYANDFESTFLVGAIIEIFDHNYLVNDVRILKEPDN